MNETLVIVADFRDFVETFLPQSSIKDNVSTLYKEIEELASLTLEPVTISTSGPVESVLEVVKEADPTPVFERSSNTGESDEMRVLIRKLDIFAQLVEKRNYLKAAIVSKDITHSIENFDPTLFFPKIFANYFVLLARHFGSLAVESNDHEGLQWQYLDKLYRIDIDEFVRW